MPYLFCMGILKLGSIFWGEITVENLKFDGWVFVFRLRFPRFTLHLPPLPHDHTLIFTSGIITVLVGACLLILVHYQQQYNSASVLRQCSNISYSHHLGSNTLILVTLQCY